MKQLGDDVSIKNRHRFASTETEQCFWRTLIPFLQNIVFFVSKVEIFNTHNLVSSVIIFREGSIMIAGPPNMI